MLPVSGPSPRCESHDGSMFTYSATASVSCSKCGGHTILEGLTQSVIIVQGSQQELDTIRGMLLKLHDTMREGGTETETRNAAAIDPRTDQEMEEWHGKHS